MTVVLFACDGAIGLTQLTADGEQQFEPLRRIRVHRNARKNGKFRVGTTTINSPNVWAAAR